MKGSSLALSAACAAAVASFAVSAAQSQASAQPQPMPQAQRPRGPILTPLGRQAQQVLLSKVTVSDLGKSFTFYTRVIGLKRAFALHQPQTPLPAPGQQQAFLEVAMNFSGSLADPFFDLVVQRGQVPTRESAKLTWIGFKVADAAAAVRRARDAGYEVVRDAPAAGPGEMSIGIVRDPDGYSVEIIQAASYHST